MLNGDARLVDLWKLNITQNSIRNPLFAWCKSTIARSLPTPNTKAASADIILLGAPMV